jgi:hypothetical protein
VVTRVDSDNLATRRQSANLWSYQEILTACLEQEYEANISTTQRDLRANRRYARTLNSTPTISDQNTDSDQTLSEDTTLTTSSQNSSPPRPQQPATPPTPEMPLPTDFPFFSGDPNDDKAEKPGLWLKHLERTWSATTSNTDNDVV